MRNVGVAISVGVLAAAGALAGSAAGGQSAPPALRHVNIVHVAHGCHVWSAGSRANATMQMTLRRGGQLHVVNHDIDLHRLVQTAGPRLPKMRQMSMHGNVRITLRRPGRYRFTTQVTKMGRMPMSAAHGGDNVLRLIVVVS